MPHFNSFADVHRLLNGRSNHTKRPKPSLDYMFELLERLGNPHQDLKVIHVAGTSGKTSTAYYTAALLQAAGHKVGLTVSPHIDEINERVQINLRLLPEAEYAKRFEEFWRLAKDTSDETSYFELSIAFALWEFTTQKVDYAVIEVGIGGLMDSTNIFDQPDKVCVITDIGYDHMHLLGDTLPEIAAHKAGIIQLHNAVFCYRQSPEATEVIRARAVQKQGDLHILSPQDAAAAPDFLPLFQKRNFTLALAAVQWALKRDNRPQLSDKQITKAAQTYIPARMEVLTLEDKTVVLDIAHNPQKLHALLKSVHARYGGRPIAALLCLPVSSRRIHGASIGLEEVIKNSIHHLIFTGLSEAGDLPDQSFDPVYLAAICRKAGYKSFEAVADPVRALAVLRARPEPILLVTGSTYLLNHIRPLLRH